MNPEEFGAVLQSEREKRHLSIEQASDTLKINARILRALESGDASRLPPPAYAKGFIRTYASWLGLGNDEIQEMLAGLQQGPQRTQSQPASEPAPAIHSKPHKKNGKGLYIFIVLLILGGAGYWLWNEGHIPSFQMEKRSQVDSIDKLPAADEWAATKLSESEKTPALHVPVGPEPEQVKVSEKETGADSGESPQLENPASTLDKEAPSIVEAKTEPEKTPELQKGPHKLIITAIEECWVHSNADKTDTRQFSLRKGDTFALTFANTLDLKLGNAGGVRLRYDGVDLDAPGTSGQVKTMRFPPKND